jgi:hypothetical protein
LPCLGDAAIIVGVVLERDGGSAMFRRPFRSAVLLAIGLVGSEFLVAAGAPGPFLNQTAAQKKKQDEVKIALGDESMVTNKPLTVSMREELTPKLRSKIARAMELYPEATVRLKLEVSPPESRESILGFKVFLNKPDATAATPVDDPHYVTTKVFATTRGDIPQAFIFDVLKTLAALKKSEKLDIMDAEKPLKLTIVANPAPGVERLPDDASFAVNGLTVKVSEPVKQ